MTSARATQELIAEVLRLDEEATKGPWRHERVEEINEHYVAFAARGFPNAFVDDYPREGQPDYEWTLQGYEVPRKAVNEQANRDAQLIACYRTAAPELARRLRAAEAVIEAALDYRAANTDGHECPRDGNECDECRLTDALRATR